MTILSSRVIIVPPDLVKYSYTSDEVLARANDLAGDKKITLSDFIHAKDELGFSKWLYITKIPDSRWNSIDYVIFPYVFTIPRGLEHISLNDDSKLLQHLNDLDGTLLKAYATIRSTLKLMTDVASYATLA